MIFELAKKYYPHLWDRSRLDALLAAGRLTQTQYAETIGGIDNADHTGN